MDADRHIHVLTHVADTISAGAILGSILGWFPPIAALAATVWYSVQIWESHTVQKWWRLFRYRRRTYAGVSHRGRHQKAAKKIIDTIGAGVADIT